MGQKDQKDHFWGSLRVGPTHGLIALLRFALGLDNFCPKKMKYSNFLALSLCLSYLSTIINKTVIVHFHPDFDLHPNWLFWHFRVRWTLTYFQRVATWKEGTVVVSLLDIHTWASNTTWANLYNVQFVHLLVTLFVVPCIHHSQECPPYVLKCVSPNPCRCFSTDGFHVWHSTSPSPPPWTFLPMSSQETGCKPNILVFLAQHIIFIQPSDPIHCPKLVTME